MPDAGLEMHSHPSGVARIRRLERCLKRERRLRRNVQVVRAFE